MSSINPLNIPSYLSQVLEYITSVEDVKNVRKVSTDFCVESLGQWRNTKRLLLFGIPDGYPGILTRDFLEILKDSGKVGDNHKVICKPYRDYYIRNEPSLCSPQTGNDLNDLNNLFWNELGNHMQTLQLSKSCYLPRQNFPSGLQWLLLNACQNLKELHINSPIIVPDRNVKEGPCNIPMALDNGNFLRSTAPALTVLSLTNFHQSLFFPNFEDNLEMGKNLFNMMPHLSSLQLDASTQRLIVGLPHSLQSTGTFIKLESLDLDFTHCFQGQSYTLFSNLIRYINVAKPSLKHLKLKYNYFEVLFLPGMLQTIFSVCAATLKSLELILNFDSIPLSQSHITFSDLLGIEIPHLTHLLVTIEGYWKPFGPIHSFHFDFRSLLIMPSLQVFRCVGDLTTEQVKQLGDNFVNLPKQLENELEEISEYPLNHLKVFEYTLPQKFSFQDLTVLRMWMPAIKKIAVFCDKRTVPVTMFFDMWKNLKSVKSF